MCVKLYVKDTPTPDIGETLNSAMQKTHPFAPYSLPVLISIVLSKSISSLIVDNNEDWVIYPADILTTLIFDHDLLHQASTQV
jgi:hypothetical protein